MNTHTPALLRFPLPTILLISISLWGIGIPALADSPSITGTSITYPSWSGAPVGMNQDSLKFGDQTSIAVEITDDAPIRTVIGDFSAFGIADPVSLSPYRELDATHHQYRVTTEIASHATGPAPVHIVATDNEGRSTETSISAYVDNTPPLFRLDSLSFASASTTPAPNDTMLVSGFIDQDESKIFVTDTYYSLYDANRTPVFAFGNYTPKGLGTALSDLGKGPFSDDPLQLELDRNEAFHVPDAAYIAITASVTDGAGNTATTTSPLTPIPHGTGAAAPPAGMSNVLFLPGIEGSRLYTMQNGSEEKVWDPSSGSDLALLSLNEQGKSMHDVYTKEHDTLNAVGPFTFYQSLADDMNGLTDTGAMNEWSAVAYDWRLSLSDIVHGGAQHGTNIDYGEATSTPYIEQTLRALAATSKSGKVSIIAHSAGGLVAKALLQKLGDAETARLVDKVVFVGVPQSGTPLALAGLLYGYGGALPADWCAAWIAVGPLCSVIASREQSRMLAHNAPMIYDLLPSSTYFADVQDPAHPVASLNGMIVDTETELDSFATASALSTGLIAEANQTHSELDAWSPPPSVAVYQLAGWGTDTLSGIQYYQAPNLLSPGTFTQRYRPQFVEDGDGTVTIPSALMMPLSENVKRYWINVSKTIAVAHANVLELPNVREFIANILSNRLGALPSGITGMQPASINPKKKLLFTLHGRANATLRASSGQTSVLNADGTSEPGIPGVQTGQFGDTGFLLASADESYQFTIQQIDDGAVDVDVQYLVDDVITDTSSFQDVSGQLDVAADGTVSTSTIASSTPAPATPSKGIVLGKPVVVSRTVGIHNSKSVLTQPKPIKEVTPKPAPVKKTAAPKAKPLTAKAKKTINELLTNLQAQLQGLLVRLGH